MSIWNVISNLLAGIFDRHYNEPEKAAKILKDNTLEASRIIFAPRQNSDETEKKICEKTRKRYMRRFLNTYVDGIEKDIK